jgi:hypothetical protein
MTKKNLPGAEITLESVLYQGISILATHTLNTFQDIDLINKNSPPKVQKAFSDHIKNLKKVQTSMQSLSQEDVQFTAKDMKTLLNIHKSLEEILTNEEVNNLIAERLQKAQKASPYEKLNTTLYQYMPQLGVISGIQGIAAYASGSMWGALICAIPAMYGLNVYLDQKAEKHQYPTPKKPPRFATAINFTLLQTGSLVTNSALKQEGIDIPYEHILKPITLLNQMSGFVGSIASLLGFSTDIYFEEKISSVKRSNRNFQFFARTGVALKIAHDNLAYVDRVCDSEQRSKTEFDDQKEYLISAIAAYISHEAQVEDLFEAKIKYKPKSQQFQNGMNNGNGKQKVHSQHPNGSHNGNGIKTKVGYTPKEYAALRAERLAIRHQEQTKKSNEIKGSTSSHTLDEITTNSSLATYPIIATSHYIAQNLDETVQRYSMDSLVDITKEKIISNLRFNEETKNWVPIPNGNLINLRANAWGEALREKYDIDPAKVTLYKIQPAGALRAIVGLNNNDNTYIIYDILTHTEYDRMVK